MDVRGQTLGTPGALGGGGRVLPGVAQPGQLGTSRGSPEDAGYGRHTYVYMYILIHICNYICINIRICTHAP